MSAFDYHVAKKLWCDDTPFYALLMAAMLRADPYNAALLGSVFPQVRRELAARCDTPGGELPGDAPIRLKVTRVETGDEFPRSRCSECGRSWSDTACGTAHAIIAAEPRLHR